MMFGIVVTCIIAIQTHQGQICIKPDGNVDLPPSLETTQASKDFWEEIGKIYNVIKQEKCTP